VQRVWRLVDEIADGCAPGNESGDEALPLRKAAHRALASVGGDVERLAFNRCVAHIYTLANAIGKAADQFRPKAEGEAFPAAIAPALREAATILVQLIAPMMPHLAEECWTRLGGEGLVSHSNWPQFDPALLDDDTLTLPVQVNGKKRADLTIAKTAAQTDIEAAVLALESVQKALEGRAPKKIIIVPQRIINVVG
jgi:leucyl-tRNA synthetase